MELDKQEIMKKLEEKGMSVAAAAEAIQFDPLILNLYMAKDSYPMPTRIIKKLSEVVIKN